MREIKFRAWDKKRGHFHWGIGNVCLTLGGRLMWQFGYQAPDILSREEARDYVLQQYTGLKDNTKWEQLTKAEQEGETKETWNGKEIYEGDIVKATGQRYDYLQVIEFHNTGESCGRGWIGRNLKQLASPLWKTPEEDISGRFSYFCWPATWEVIGNIYENPDYSKRGG